MVKRTSQSQNWLQTMGSIKAGSVGQTQSANRKICALSSVNYALTMYQFPYLTGILHGNKAGKWGQVDLHLKFLHLSHHLEPANQRSQCSHTQFWDFSRIGGSSHFDAFAKLEVKTSQTQRRLGITDTQPGEIVIDSKIGEKESKSATM